MPRAFFFGLVPRSRGAGLANHAHVARGVAPSWLRDAARRTAWVGTVVGGVVFAASAAIFFAFRAGDPSRVGEGLQAAHNAAALVTFPGRLPAALAGALGAPEWARVLLVAATGAACWALGAAGFTLVAWWVARGSDADAARAASPADVRRREVLVAGTAGGAALVAGAALAKGAALDPHDLRVRRYDIALRDLPESLVGLRLVQVTDLHLGNRMSGAFVTRCLRTALAERPDVLLLTGDYVHKGAASEADARFWMAPLVEQLAGVACVGVLGNHDFYAEPEHTRAVLRDAGVRLVDNARAFVRASDRGVVAELAPGEDGLCLAGVGDYLEDRVDIDAALAGVREGMPRIVLSHNPDAAEEPTLLRHAHRVDLMVSGHTHGGQMLLPVVGPPFVPSRFGRKYLGGLVEGPAFPVLVSRGLGTSFLPLRLNVPPELVVLTLRRA